MYNISTNQSSAIDLKYVSKLQPFEDIIIGVYTILLGVESGVMNLLVFGVMFARRKFIKPQDVLVINLSVADMGIVFSTFHMMATSAFNHKWTYGDTGCVFYGFISFMFSMVSMMTLFTISLTRYLVVCHRQEVSAKVVNKRSTASLIVLIYMYAIFWTVCPLMGWAHYDVEPFGYSCTIQWINGSKSYVAFVTVFCCFGPMLGMVFFYMRISWFVYINSEKMEQRLTRANKKSKTSKSIHTTRIGLMLCSGYFIAWLPYAIVSYIATFGDPSSIPIRATVVPVLLAKTSMGYNPVVYSLTSKSFRAEIAKLFRKIFRLQEPKRKESVSATAVSTVSKAGNRAGPSTSKVVPSQGTDEITEVGEGNPNNETAF